MNLTAITEYEEVILKHFLDSLSIVKVSNFDQNKLAGKSVIDIGTGAGFPGIPLKIAFPELKITLLEMCIRDRLCTVWINKWITKNI